MMRQIENVSSTEDGCHVVISCADAGVLYFHNENEKETGCNALASVSAATQGLSGSLSELSHLSSEGGTGAGSASTGCMVVCRVGSSGDVILARAAAPTNEAPSLVVELLRSQLPTTPTTTPTATATAAPSTIKESKGSAPDPGPEERAAAYRSGAPPPQHAELWNRWGYYATPPRKQEDVVLPLAEPVDELQDVSPVATAPSKASRKTPVMPRTPADALKSGHHPHQGASNAAGAASTESMSLVTPHHAGGTASVRKQARRQPHISPQDAHERAGAGTRADAGDNHNHKRGGRGGSTQQLDEDHNTDRAAVGATAYTPMAGPAHAHRGESRKRALQAVAVEAAEPAPLVSLERAMAPRPKLAAALQLSKAPRLAHWEESTAVRPLPAPGASVQEMREKVSALGEQLTGRLEAATAAAEEEARQAWGSVAPPLLLERCLAEQRRLLASFHQDLRLWLQEVPAVLAERGGETSAGDKEKGKEKEEGAACPGATETRHAGAWEAAALLAAVEARARGRGDWRVQRPGESARQCVGRGVDLASCHLESIRFCCSAGVLVPMEQLPRLDFIHRDVVQTEATAAVEAVATMAVR